MKVGVQVMSTPEKDKLCAYLGLVTRASYRTRYYECEEIHVVIAVILISTLNV